MQCGTKVLAEMKAALEAAVEAALRKVVAEFDLQSRMGAVVNSAQGPKARHPPTQRHPTRFSPILAKNQVNFHCGE